MRNAILAACIFLTAFCGAAFAEEAATAAASDTAGSVYGNTPEFLRPYSGGVREPYRQFFTEPLEYPGPGHDKLEPNVDTVRIGVLAPIERSRETYLGRPMMTGCRMAVDEANAEGGYTGRPFALTSRNDTGLWGASANEIVSFSYDDSVWAVVGSIDGANTHIAIRVALKTEVPVVNVGDTDPTLVETMIPWIFRVIADDRQMCYTIAHHLYEDRGFERAAILRANNRYGRFGVAEFRQASIRLGHPAPIEVNYDLRWATTDTTFALQVERLRRVKPDAIILWGDAEPMGHLVRLIRAAGIDAELFGSDRVVNDAFTDAAGATADGIVAVTPYDPTRDDTRLKAFQRRYRERFGSEPNVYAAHAYDGTRMVIDAIRTAGLNRYRIRDALAGMRTYDGVTGEMRFDNVQSDRSPVSVATYRDGVWTYGVPRVSRRF